MEWWQIVLICVAVVFLLDGLIIILTCVLTFINDREIKKCANVIRNNHNKWGMRRGDK